MALINEGDDAELSSSKPPDRDLYSIPIYSSWFQWDEIHDTERRSLPEFFDGTSISRNPRVYKEYRDFIISKYREDPSRRLTFTEIRKSLVGDVGALHRVFSCLDRWGLINFGAGEVVEWGGGAAPAVVVEDGAPIGLRVLPASATATAAVGGAVGSVGSVVRENGFRLPPLTSYADVFGDWVPGSGPVCGVCGNRCQPEQCETTRGGFIKCLKCSLERDNNEEASSNNSDPNVHEDGSSDLVPVAWTDAELLLLLEGVMKHGDDWDLIAQHVKTKNKFDCIAKLVQLPFGDHMPGTGGNKYDNRKGSADIKTIHNDLPQHPQEIISGNHETETDGEKITEEFIPTPPLKKRRKSSMQDATDSLMQQVALLSTVAGPDVAAAAADAAVSALCKENPYAWKVFDTDQDGVANNFGSVTKNELKSERMNEDQDVERHTEAVMRDSAPEKHFIAAAFRIRAAIGTALGAAAAYAKLLADQEEREIEHLMASIIDMQLKKVQYKIKHFEELESIMEKEYAYMQQLKESILEEWMGLLEQTFSSGIPRWSDQAIPWPLLNSVL